VPSVTDFLLWYAKDRNITKYKQLFSDKQVGGEGGSGYTNVESPDGKVRRQLTKEEIENSQRIPTDWKPFFLGAVTSQGASPNTSIPFEFQNKVFYPGHDRHWTTAVDGLKRLANIDRISVRGNGVAFVRYLDDFPVQPITNVWRDTSGGGFIREEKLYVVQTATRVIERCLLMTTDPGDLVLDPTCGSGTTAYVAEQWGRRWITIDTSRVALALARTRLMAGRFPYYLLADSTEGKKKEMEASGQWSVSSEQSSVNGEDIKKGFVYKRVPHITLKSIANNEEIDAIHTKWQEKLEPLRARINQAAGKKWEEWEIPREASEQSSAVSDLLKEWWHLRRERQKEIDESISRHADIELLYDQPYEDNKRIRVTGPFTVESLSPHRVLSTDEELPVSETDGRKESSAGQFEAMIIENLKKAGVQNTVKNERLKFDRLESYAGIYLHAAGEYTEKQGAVKRVAVSIGPEHGTVGPDQVKEAAKEAVQGVGFDLLIVCGFAFDPHVSEEAKRYGKLTVLTAQMNPDLAMGDELLKKTGAGNLFMVFGEPDIEMKKQKDGKLVVVIKGVDVYDPTTGEIRNSSTNDIACWFIDTNYNGESFFVRHAYFTGGNEPYEKLKRALRAEIDEAAWSALYSTQSMPFDSPKTGKIAVKVINHYGDEVMKVYAV
jgi:adenine-specific DNA-methyltransferase